MLIVTSENTYIRFRFENKRAENEKQALNGIFRSWNYFEYRFQVKIWTNAEIFKNVKEYRTINPTRSYWEKYYKKESSYYGSGINSLYFVEGCDYRMPIPVGKTK